MGIKTRKVLIGAVSSAIVLLLACMFVYAADKAREEEDPTIFRGKDYFDRGMYDEAIEKLTREAKEHSDVELFYTRGTAYAAKGDLDKAILDYNTAIKLSARVYYERGVAYSRKGEMGVALADFNKSIDIDPDFPAVYLNRGIIRAKEGYRPLRDRKEYGKGHRGFLKGHRA
jgi:tetratricopeptide (TPR) repeat protein